MGVRDGGEGAGATVERWAAALAAARRQRAAPAAHGRWLRTRAPRWRGQQLGRGGVVGATRQQRQKRATGHTSAAATTALHPRVILSAAALL